MNRKHDTFRKWRELTDLVNARFSTAFNPSQHLGIDEATRATKHWEKRRIQYSIQGQCSLKNTGGYVKRLQDQLLIVVRRAEMEVQGDRGP